MQRTRWTGENRSPDVSAPAVTLSVDGRAVTAPSTLTVLELLQQLGRAVPHLCHDSRLAPAGLCRLCVVELQGSSVPVPACTTRVANGMVIRTESAALHEHRRGVLEMLAQRYPADAVGVVPEKPLHRYFSEYGIDAQASAKPADDSHPYIRVDPSRCIACRRCVRICDEVQGCGVWHVLGRGCETRIEPEPGPRLLDSRCVSCGACADTCPTGAIEDKGRLTHGAPDSWTRTTCPYCGAGCELLLGARAGRLVASKPVPDAAVSRGHACVKGRYAFEFVHAPDRILEPMIRRGDGWRVVTWSEAIEFVVGALESIRAAHGADAVGVLASARATNEDNYLAQKLARVALGTNNVDCCARVCHAPTAAAMSRMLGTGAATNSFDDIERAGLILVCGCNPTENHPIVGARIQQAARRGVPLIVIDPRRIELAHDASIHLRPRPGTNVPLLNAMACTLLEEGLCDREFLDRRVDDFHAFARFIEAYTPEAVAAITGVPCELIRAAARSYATAKPAMMFHGLGVTEHSQGTAGVMSLVNLALLTGNLGKPGAGVNPLRGQNNVQGAAHMGCEPRHLTGYADLTDAGRHFSSVWQAPLPEAAGSTLLGMMDGARAGKLKALLTVGYDILLTNANAHDTEAALAALELLVVQDLFMNETARRFAHVFLPAASSFEKDGTFMNSERRVQRVRKVIDAPGNCKADWEIACALGSALGHERAFSFASAEAVWNEIRTLWPAGAGITYERLEHAGLQWPCPSEEHPGTPILHQHSFAKRPRASLACVDYAPSAEQVTDQYPLLLVTGRTLHQFNAGTMTARSGGTALWSHDRLAMHPRDALELGLRDGQRVDVCSRHGSAVLPVTVTDSVSPGELFATFHTPAAFVNQITGPYRDADADTPEYKVTAVRVRPSS